MPISIPTNVEFLRTILVSFIRDEVRKVGLERVVVGLSHFLPGGGADESSSKAERVYVVLEGQITVTTEDGPVLLGPLDSCLIPPGETRSVQNASNRPASMLVIAVP